MVAYSITHKDKHSSIRLHYLSKKCKSIATRIIIICNFTDIANQFMSDRNVIVCFVTQTHVSLVDLLSTPVTFNIMHAAIAISRQQNYNYSEQSK